MADLGKNLGEAVFYFAIGFIVVLLFEIGVSFIKWSFHQLGKVMKHHREKQAIKRQLRLYLNEQQKLLLRQLRVEQTFTVLREKMLEEALKDHDK